MSELEKWIRSFLLMTTILLCTYFTVYIFITYPEASIIVTVTLILIGCLKCLKEDLYD